MIEKKVPIVVNKTYNKVLYIAEDGNKFTNKEQCEKYEKDLTILKDMKHIPKFEESIFNYESWFYISKIEDLTLFKQYLIQIVNKGAYLHIEIEDENKYIPNNIENATFLLNKWVSYRIEYNADDADDCYLITLDYIQEAYNKIKRKADDII